METLGDFVVCSLRLVRGAMSALCLVRTLFGRETLGRFVLLLEVMMDDGLFPIMKIT